MFLLLSWILDLGSLSSDDILHKFRMSSDDDNVPMRSYDMLNLMREKLDQYTDEQRVRAELFVLESAAMMDEEAGVVLCESRRGDTLVQQWKAVIVRHKYSVCHRYSGPAVRIFRQDSLIREEYREFGELHRIDGPAFITFHSNGSTCCEAYYRRGLQIY